MKSLEAFIKKDFPEAYKAYQEYKKVETKKEKEEAKKLLAEAIKNRCEFSDYSFDYEYETSYKGWTEGPYDESISFKEAFERVEDVTIDPDGFSGGMSFKEFLEYICETESEFFKRWFEILKGKRDDLAEKIGNEDYRVAETPVYSNLELFTTAEIKDFFRKAKYKESN